MGHRLCFAAMAALLVASRAVSAAPSVDAARFLRQDSRYADGVRVTGVQAGGAIAGRTHVPGNRIHTDGFHGRGFGGFNMQNGHFVYGVEGDIGYDGSSGSRAGVRSRGGIDGSLRGRAGRGPSSAPSHR